MLVPGTAACDALCPFPLLTDVKISAKKEELKASKNRPTSVVLLSPAIAREREKRHPRRRVTYIARQASFVCVCVYA